MFIILIEKYSNTHGCLNEWTYYEINSDTLNWSTTHMLLIIGNDFAICVGKH